MGLEQIGLLLAGIGSIASAGVGIAAAVKAGDKISSIEVPKPPELPPPPTRDDEIVTVSADLERERQQAAVATRTRIAAIGDLGAEASDVGQNVLGPVN